MILHMVKNSIGGIGEYGVVSGLNNGTERLFSIYLNTMCHKKRLKKVKTQVNKMNKTLNSTLNIKIFFFLYTKIADKTNNNNTIICFSTTKTAQAWLTI